MNLFYDLYQNRLIREASAAAEKAVAQAEGADDRLRVLERRIETLTLACQALWELHQQETGDGDEVLVRKMEEIDGRDGVVDGRLSPPPQTCAACGRKSSATRQRCLYCNAPLAAKAI